MILFLGVFGVLLYFLIGLIVAARVYKATKYKPDASFAAVLWPLFIVIVPAMWAFEKAEPLVRKPIEFVWNKSLHWNEEKEDQTC